MSERIKLFSPSAVQAILNGHPKQRREAVKPATRKQTDVYADFEKWCTGRIMSPIDNIISHHTRRIIDLETRIAALEAALDKLTGEK